jgi:hypothetical protein
MGQQLVSPLLITSDITMVHLSQSTIGSMLGLWFESEMFPKGSCVEVLVSSWWTQSLRGDWVMSALISSMD